DRAGRRHAGGRDRLRRGRRGHYRRIPVRREPRQAARAAMITRLRLGSILRPGSETPSGDVRAEGVFAYLVRHEDGPILFDTGIGAHPEVDEHYRPTRYALSAVLSRIGLTPADISTVVNCHLHFDHCGGNPLFPDRPILVQRGELETARTT